MIKKEVQNAVTHHAHAFSKLLEIDPDAFGIYSQRMLMTLQLAKLMHEAFSTFMNATEFDNRSAIILGSDADVVTRLKQEVQSLTDTLNNAENAAMQSINNLQDSVMRAERVTGEYKDVLALTEEKANKFETEITELHKLMAAQRELINRCESANKLFDDDNKALRAENQALKNAQNSFDINSLPI